MAKWLVKRLVCGRLTPQQLLAWLSLLLRRSYHWQISMNGPLYSTLIYCHQLQCRPYYAVHNMAWADYTDRLPIRVSIHSRVLQYPDMPRIHHEVASRSLLNKVHEHIINAIKTALCHGQQQRQACVTASHIHVAVLVCLPITDRLKLGTFNDYPMPYGLPNPITVIPYDCK